MDTEPNSKPSFTVLHVEGVTPMWSRQGGHVSLIVNGEDRTVTTFSCIGPGTPFEVFHNRARRFLLPERVTTQSIKDFVEANASLIEDLLDTFLETEWDNHNHVGRWSDAMTEAEDRLQAAKEEYPFETYWEACDWFQSFPRLAWEEACRHDTIGKAAVAIVETNAGDAALDSGDVERYLKGSLLDVPEDDTLYAKAQELLKT